MEAFYKNIDALEKQTEVLIQKWASTRQENQQLIERNKQLEEEIQAQNSVVVPPVESTSEPIQNNSPSDLSYIKEALEKYIQKIDTCLEQINIELDGK